MAENEKNIKLDDVREEIREALKVFGEEMIAGLGDNLRSITVVGSSLTEDFRSGRSDINTVLVLGKQTLGALKTIAGISKSMRKKKLSAPLLMTEAYIERSRDVFGIEFLDFQLMHETIFGEDPFATLSFAKEHVRLQCERELKATLIRLRQGYVAAAANKRLVRDILISAAKGLGPLLRGMLWLKDVERPNTSQKTLSKSASDFSVNMDSLRVVGRWRHEKIRLSEAEIEDAFEAVYATVEQLAVVVDKLEV